MFTPRNEYTIKTDEHNIWFVRFVKWCIAKISHKKCCVPNTRLLLQVKHSWFRVKGLGFRVSGQKSVRRCAWDVVSLNPTRRALWSLAWQIGRVSPPLAAEQCRRRTHTKKLVPIAATPCPDAHHSESARSNSFSFNVKEPKPSLSVV